MEDLPCRRADQGMGDQDEVLKAIIKAKGANNFKLPHTKDVVDLDWEAMFEEWEDEPSEQESESE